ncbi:MAG: Holliday junction branch migration protein RuvA [Fusobacterium sp.]|nr:Holliday junction branch migration protein RuvA [Fusobacterium sp.]
MYDYIKGIVTNKSGLPRGLFVTVEAFGLGYLLEVTGRDFNSLEVSEAQTKIYTVLNHKEDKMSLCGFVRKEDRDIFNVLTSVSGVGVKMALTLLDRFSASELIGLVIEGNYKELTLAKGVGPKLAQKIILELKDKLINYQKDWSAPNFVEKIREENSNLVDAQSVLLSLGYEKNEIKTAFAKLSVELGENATAEEILQSALRLLSA